MADWKDWVRMIFWHSSSRTFSTKFFGAPRHRICAQESEEVCETEGVMVRECERERGRE